MPKKLLIPLRNRRLPMLAGTMAYICLFAALFCPAVFALPLYAEADPPAYPEALTRWAIAMGAAASAKGR